MSRTTLRPGATAPAPVRASTAAGAAPASAPIERSLRSAGTRLASVLWIVGAGDATPTPSAVAAAARRARRRALRRRATRLPGVSVGTRLPAAGPRALRPDGLKRAARRRACGLLLRALADRQHYLYRHSEGVAALSRAVGGRLGLEAVELREVIETAELHDVGKLALPDEILEKPGALDDEEWKLMRQHTIVGERIVGALPAVADVGPLVRASHERWDGRGYPDGLAGEDIPLASRIVFACDASTP